MSEQTIIKIWRTGDHTAWLFVMSEDAARALVDNIEQTGITGSDDDLIHIKGRWVNSPVGENYGYELWIRRHEISAITIGEHL